MHLVLSDDGMEVKDRGEDEDIDDAPERLDLFGSVLPLSCLASEKSYWEVKVCNKTDWDLGVLRGEANLKGNFSLNPENDYWVTAL